MKEYLAHFQSVSFDPGEVLTREMLTETYSFPRTLMKILTDKVDNCIVGGFRFECRDKKVYLSPGCLKFDGNIYFCDEEIDLQELWQEFKTKHGGKTAGGGHIYLRFYPLECKAGRSYGNITDKVMRLEFTQGDCKDGFVMGWMQYIEDEILLCDSINTIDDGNCLGLLQVKYGYNGVITFHPEVFKCIIRSLRNKTEKDQLDECLLMILSNEGVGTKDLLRNYIRGKEVDVDDNEDGKGLIKKLETAINEKTKIQSSFSPTEKPGGDGITKKPESKRFY